MEGIDEGKKKQILHSGMLLGKVAGVWRSREIRCVWKESERIRGNSSTASSSGRRIDTEEVQLRTALLRAGFLLVAPGFH